MLSNQLPVDGVLESCLYATDLEAAERFYTSVIGLEVMSRAADRHVFFWCGPGVFLVFNPDHTSAEPTTVSGTAIPLHGAHGAGHVAFRVAEHDLPAWRQRLREAGVAIESEVHWPNGGTSIYFRDPAGNSIEIAPATIWGIEEP